MANDLFRARPIFVTRFSNTESLIGLMGGTAVDIVHNSIANLLLSCREFLTLQVHVKRYWDKARLPELILLTNGALQYGLSHNQLIPFTSKPILDFITNVLSLLKDKGFLVPRDEFLIGAHPIHPPSLISTVGFVTKNRPESLYRSVESFMEHSRRYNRKNDFAIFDDSQREETHERIKAIPKSCGEIFYAGRKEKLVFIQKLSENGIPPDILQFLLFGMDPEIPTHGGNRNAFLLHVAGELAFSADDDVICRIGRSPSFQEGVKIGRAEMAENLWTYSDRESAVKGVPPVQVDILALHETVLGQPTYGVVQKQALSKDEKMLLVEDMDSNLMDLMVRDQSKVVVTVNGLVGDSGMSSSDIMIFTTGESRKRILESETKFKNSLLSREVVKFTDQLLLFPAGSIMTTFFGVDARETIPPYFPMFRGEDGLFGHLIGATMKGACFGFLPWTLLHDPEDHRLYESDRNDDGQPYFQFSPPFIIQELISRLDPVPVLRRESEGLRFIGTLLKDYGSMPEKEFQEILHRNKLQILSNDLMNLLAVLKNNSDFPKFYKEEVNRRMNAARRHLSQPFSFPTSYLVGKNTLDAEAGVKFLQRSIYLFGEALIWWPQILAVTKELKQKGIRLGQIL